MIKTYREIGIETYGHACEICGRVANAEVHHINYQEHQALEDKIRTAAIEGHKEELAKLLDEAKKKNFLTWDGLNLGKDNSSKNLSVLCPNDHVLVHTYDVGMNILKALPPRK